MFLEVYEFHYKPVPLLAGAVLKKLSHVSNSKTYISLDLGLSLSRVTIDENYIILEDYGIKLPLSKILESKVKENSVYAIINENIQELSLTTKNKYYKLKASYLNKAPTLEISGIHMHRIKGIDPWKDSLLKVKKTRIKKGNIVLDTCTGLGYTAIGALRFGAKHVFTVEIDESVLALSQYNPWSKFLEDDRVTILLGDVFEVIDFFQDEIFDRIIHDPPRFSLAGHLYSREFYRKLYQKLKPGGILFHYIGSPGWRRRVNMVKGVMNRLREVGFYVKTEPKAQGVIAFKPRI